LPVSFSEIQQIAADFYRTIASSNIPNVAQTVKNCANFEPRIELRIFLETIALCQKPLLMNPNGSEAASESVKVLRQCWENVTLFNQSPTSALEILVKDLSKINVTHNKIFSKM
jgi:DNA polymerase-3 subunit gamma/tau